MNELVYHAFASGSYSSVLYLLNYGASGKYIIKNAILTGDIKLVNSILVFGEDPNDQDTSLAKITYDLKNLYIYRSLVFFGTNIDHPLNKTTEDTDEVLKEMNKIACVAIKCDEIIKIIGENSIIPDETISFIADNLTIFKGRICYYLKFQKIETVELFINNFSRIINSIPEEKYKQILKLNHLKNHMDNILILKDNLYYLEKSILFNDFEKIFNLNSLIPQSIKSKILSYLEPGDVILNFDETSLVSYFSSTYSSDEKDFKKPIINQLYNLLNQQFLSNNSSNIIKLKIISNEYLLSLLYNNMNFQYFISRDKVESICKKISLKDTDIKKYISMDKWIEQEYMRYLDTVSDTTSSESFYHHTTKASDFLVPRSSHRDVTLVSISHKILREVSDPHKPSCKQELNPKRSLSDHAELEPKKYVHEELTQHFSEMFDTDLSTAILASGEICYSSDER